MIIAPSLMVLVVGCTQRIVTPHREGRIVLLDNRGGDSHAGRRIALRVDGSYTDISYTDVVGDEHTKRGRYTLNPERTHLILLPKGGEIEDLTALITADSSIGLERPTESALPSRASGGCGRFQSELFHDIQA